MAPKGKGKEEAAAPPPPTDSLGLVLFSDEALAAENFACDPPFEDDAGTQLPNNLYAGMLSWKRPSEFLEELLADGETTPCVVQAPPAAEDGTVPPLGRALPNVLSQADVAAEAAPSVQWLVSCFQLVALQAELLDEGSFLWELVYPKGDDGLPAYQPGGKYAVRMWEQGAWRLIVVDDRMPVGSSGELLLPTSTNALELWPLLLAKALYKLTLPYETSVSQDPSVLLRLTGWLPETIPISPYLPAEAAFETIAHFLPSDRQCALGVMLPAGVEESLAAVGLAHGPLVAVRDARAVDGQMYIRLESELIRWTGELCDTDEATWTPSLANSLEWKRLQRLRKHAAGWPLHDFWLSLASLNAHFGAMLVLHRPQKYASVVSHTGEATAAGAAPTLLHVPAAEDGSDTLAEVVLSLASRPQAPAEEGLADGDEPAPTPPATAPYGSCIVSLARSEWSAACEAGEYMRVPVSSASTVSLSLARGITYQLTPMAALPDGFTTEEAPGYVPALPLEEEAPEEAPADGAPADGAPAEEGGEAAEAAVEGSVEEPPAEEEPTALPPIAARPCHYTLTACCESDVYLGDVATIATERLGLRVLTLEGSTAELAADEWSMGVCVSLKASEVCTLAASLSFAEAPVGACARFHLVGEDTREEVSFLGMSTGLCDLDPAANPSGYLLIADVKSPNPLPPSAWSLQLQSTAELETKVLEAKPTSLADTYPPNESYTLFRLIVSTADKDKCTGAVHVTCTEPTATLCVRAIQLVNGDPPLEVSSASGLGCATLFALAVEPPPPPPGKGQEPLPSTTMIIEGTIDRLSALELGIAVKAPPPPPEGEEPAPGLGWSVTAVSAGTLTLAKDPAREEELKALAASWESAQPGRAAKAKESRDKYLADLEAAAAEKAATLEAAAAPAEQDAEEGAEAPPPPPPPVEETAAPAEEPALPNVAYKAVSDGGVGVVWAAEDKETWKTGQQETLERVAAERTVAEEAREGIRELMSAKSNEIIEATKAKRAEKAEAYAAFAADREALLTRLLPEPPTPAEPEDKKGKGKKK